MKGISPDGGVVIQALDVDRADAWPDGQDRQENEAYPSDLTDEEWERIAPLMPRALTRGRRRTVEFREVINAVRYLVRSGCGWGMLPIHFGPWQTIYWWFRRLQGFCFRPSTTWN
jgi:hypothetical protein